MLDFKDDAASIERQNGMPYAFTCFDYRNLLSQYTAIAYLPLRIKREDQEATPQRGEQLPGLGMSVWAHVGFRLHGNGQALNRVGQFWMQIVIHPSARVVLCLVAELRQLCKSEFIHVSLCITGNRTMASILLMKQGIGSIMGLAYDTRRGLASSGRDIWDCRGDETYADRFRAPHEGALLAEAII